MPSNTSEFIRCPELEHIPSTGSWEVKKYLAYFSLTALNELVIVPAGFQTDLASIPRFVKAIIDDDDPCILEASIVHDYLYTQRNKYTRLQADKVLVEAMGVLGASQWKRALVFYAVRLFGASHWVE